jgi:hypothetical protein
VRRDITLKNWEPERAKSSPVSSEGLAATDFRVPLAPTHPSAPTYGTKSLTHEPLGDKPHPNHSTITDHSAKNRTLALSEGQVNRSC